MSGAKFIWALVNFGLLLGAAAALEPSEPKAEAPKVTLAVVDSSYKYPLGTDFLTLHPNGSISAFGSPGGPVSDEQLAEWLRGGTQEKRPDKTCFRLTVDRNKEVSVETLQRALKRIRMLADPTVEVVVFVQLDF